MRPQRIIVELQVSKGGKAVEKRIFGPFAGLTQEQSGMWVVTTGEYPKIGNHQASMQLLRAHRSGWVALVGWVPYEERNKIWHVVVIREAYDNDPTAGATETAIAGRAKPIEPRTIPSGVHLGEV